MKPEDKSNFHWAIGNICKWCSQNINLAWVKQECPSKKVEKKKDA